MRLNMPIARSVRRHRYPGQAGVVFRTVNQVRIFQLLPKLIRLNFSLTIHLGNRGWEFNGVHAWPVHPGSTPTAQYFGANCRSIRGPMASFAPRVDLILVGADPQSVSLQNLSPFSQHLLQVTSRLLPYAPYNSWKPQISNARSRSFGLVPPLVSCKINPRFDISQIWLDSPAWYIHNQSRA